MFLVSIGVCENAEKIKADFYRHLYEANKDGMDIVCEDYYIGKSLFISCGTKSGLFNKITDSKSCGEFKNILAKALAEIIIEHYEIKLLRKIVKGNLVYLNEKERSIIIDKARSLLQDEKAVHPGVPCGITRRSRIAGSILEYLDCETEFNIEGFLNFRLSSYICELSDAIERAVEIFIAEKEYNEFIKLLRYFVEIQECKIENVHLFQSKDGRYLLYDEKRNRLSSDYFDELRSEILDDTINYDDLLISALITISPKRITIHDMEGFKNKELLQTIINVFTDRIVICGKCELCSSSMTNKETDNYGL